jgi:hypothetical protein
MTDVYSCLAYFKSDYQGRYKDNPQKRLTNNHTLIKQYGIGPHEVVDSLVNHRNKVTIVLKVSWDKGKEGETKVKASGITCVSQDRLEIIYPETNLEDLL